MAKRHLPPLSSTGRKYLDGTARARLASPGLQRYPARRPGLARSLALAALLVAALVGAMLWWMQGR
jgi:hypothetical protein